MLSYEHNECEVLIYCGDFNARIGNIQDAPLCDVLQRISIDKTFNSHGQALLGFLNDNNCCILNGRSGDSKFMCTTYNRSSVVDYVITHCDMLKHIVDFKIYCIADLVHNHGLDSQSTDLPLPDHNLLSVTFRSSGLYVEKIVKGLGTREKNTRMSVPRKFRAEYMMNNRIQRVLPNLLEKIEYTKQCQKEVNELYGEICNEIQMEMEMHKKMKKRSKTKIKPYWNQRLSIA